VRSRSLSRSHFARAAPHAQLRPRARLIMVESVKWVDVVLKGVPYDVNESFMQELFTARACFRTFLRALCVRLRRVRTRSRVSAHAARAALRAPRLLAAAMRARCCRALLQRRAAVQTLRWRALLRCRSTTLTTSSTATTPACCRCACALRRCSVALQSAALRVRCESAHACMLPVRSAARADARTAPRPPQDGTDAYEAAKKAGRFKARSRRSACARAHPNMLSRARLRRC
jgi:hypothetical protein